MHDQLADFESDAGLIEHVGQKQLPILKSLSIRRLVLAGKAVREPLWHANANELGFCLSGEALVTVISNHGMRDTFTVEAGEMFFVPSGMVHAIENTGVRAAEFIVAFSHEQPEDFGLLKAFGAMSESVLSNTFGFKLERSLDFERKPHGGAIFSLSTATPGEQQSRHPNRLKYAIEASAPHVASSAGSARTAQSSNWPVLEGISMFSVRIRDNGMREPHWHPGTAEMGYVLEGEGRMTVLDPDDSAETYSIKAGDVYFVPPAYPHHIENTGGGTLHILVFFSRADPQDIGYRAAAAGYGRSVTAAELDLAEYDLPPLPVDLNDPLIVAKAWNF